MSQRYTSKAIEVKNYMMKTELRALSTKQKKHLEQEVAPN